MDLKANVTPRSSTFRIKVDLTEFGDNRLVWYLVNLPSSSTQHAAPSHVQRPVVCDTVGQLRNDLQRRFFHGRHRMSEIWLDDAVVPDDESVTLLVSNDTIRLRPSSIYDEEDGGNASSEPDEDKGKSRTRKKRKRHSKSSEPCNGIEDEENTESITKKKKSKKRVIEASPEDTKCTVDEDMIVAPEESQNEEDLESSKSKKKKSTRTKRMKHLEVMEAEPVSDDRVDLNASKTSTEVIESQVEDECSKTRKEKRKGRTILRRKRKRVLERSLRRMKKMQNVEDLLAPPTVESIDRVLEDNVHRRNVNDNAMHIRFDEDPDDDSTNNYVNQRRRSAEIDDDDELRLKEPRQFESNQPVHNGQTSNRDYKMAQRDVLNNKSLVVIRDHTIDGSQSMSDVVANGVSTQEHIPDRDYSRYPLLEGPPRVNDIICYKILELSENYTPEVSDFKVGKVLRYDALLHEILLEFPEPVALNNKRGKFELTCERDDEVELPNVYVKETTVTLTSLLEARLIVDV